MTTSPVWNYFEQVTIEGNSYYKCKVEGCVYKNKGRNHSTLMNHLQTKHTEVYTKMNIENAAKKSKDGDITQYLIQEKGNSFGDKVEDKIIDLFVNSTLPFRFIDDENFIQFVEFLNPNAKKHLFKRNTLTKKMNQMTIHHQSGIKNLISSAKFVSVSCDIWTQKNYTASFLGITAQFYNMSTKSIQNFALDLAQIEQPHTALVIRESLSKTLSYWLKPNQVIRCVTDAGANVKAAFRKQVYEVNISDDEQAAEDSNDEDALEESDFSIDEDDDMEENMPDEQEIEIFDVTDIKRITCIAHLLNTVSRNAFDTPASDIHSLKRVILKFVKQITMSAKKTEYLMEIGDKNLIKFAQTRWNSLYYVCNRLLEIKDSLIQLCTQFGIIIPFSWLDIQSLKDILKPIEKMTGIVQGDGLTISKVIPSIDELKQTLNGLKNSRFAQEIEKFIEILDKKTEFIFNEHSADFDAIYLMSTVLDPTESLKLTNSEFSTGKRHLIEYFQVTSSPVVQVAIEPTNQQRRTFSNSDTASQTMAVIQLNDYLNAIDSGNFDFSVDCLEFWSTHSKKYSLIYEKVLQILSLPASSASPERLFSHAGLYSVGRRSRIKSVQLKTRTVLKYNKPKLDNL